ncbi:kallikrein 1-related peptidase b9-like [Hydractinia symbiolongicarpus]|uniref:kallikrein 1-related peptidase b9-like n=1 Tax=Hydractinia symbiolongicarpus TaxID=13093 RepID=UPI00254A2395|nr:kallikrein 1-related peptidase b9-like [Hydractinia symbiolongicarpus]
MLGGLIFFVSFYYTQATIETVFKEKLLDIECGIYHGNMHSGHKTNNENYNILQEQHKNPNHLDLDKTLVNKHWPWQVIIKDSGEFICNGLLIKKSWVLTTASCLEKAVKLEIEIEDETYKTQSIFQHSGFDASRTRKLVGDVGLIKLSTPVPVEVKDTITPVCLPRSKSQMKQTTECVVSFLSKGKNGTQSHASAGKLLKNSDCKNFASKVDGSTGPLMCIGTTDKMRDDCSDAPIMFFTCKASGFWSVFGLSKFCSLAKTPTYKYSYAYFVELLKYLDWIKETIKKNHGPLEQIN